MGELEKRERLEALKEYAERLREETFGEGICEDELIEDSPDDGGEPVEKPAPTRLIAGKLWELRDIVEGLVGMLTLLVKESDK